MGYNVVSFQFSWLLMENASGGKNKYLNKPRCERETTTRKNTTGATTKTLLLCTVHTYRRTRGLCEKALAHCKRALSSSVHRCKRYAAFVATFSLCVAR